MIECDENGYIISEVFVGKKGLAKPLCDIFGRPQYKKIDEKPVYQPQLYTEEQTEQLRKEWCNIEIRKLYSVDEEAKIQRENFNSYLDSGKPTDKYIQYNKDVKNIIEESNNKNFQIEGN